MSRCRQELCSSVLRRQCPPAGALAFLSLPKRSCSSAQPAWLSLQPLLGWLHAVQKLSVGPLVGTSASCHFLELCQGKLKHFEAMWPVGSPVRTSGSPRLLVRYSSKSHPTLSEKNKGNLDCSPDQGLKLPWKDHCHLILVSRILFSCPANL